MKKINKFLLIPFYLCILFILSCSSPEESRTVTVGIYDNPPKIYRGKGGKGRGIFAEVLQYIAKEEGWKLEYRYEDWNTLIALIERDELDLLVDVAYSESRDRYMDYNKIALLTSWLQVYTRDSVRIDETKDLDGKTVAVLSGSFQESYLTGLNSTEGYRISLLGTSNYAETVDAVVEGRADACVVGRFFEYSNDSRSLVPSPLILMPSDLYFAAPEGKGTVLLATIDKHLSLLFNEDRHVLSKIMTANLNRYSITKTRHIIMMSLTMLLLLFLVSFTVINCLRNQIRHKARELNKQKEAMDRIHKMNLLGQLSSEISHDFNNILCGINGYIELIKLKNSNEEIDGMLDEMMDAGLQGEKIIKQILTFGRSRESQKEMTRLSKIILEVVQFLRAGFPSQTPIREHITPEEPELRLDAGRIYECIMNLCTNALQAMGRDKGELDIILENIYVSPSKQGVIGKIAKGPYMALKIRDTGPGIPPEIIDKIFEPYFSTKEAGKGTGLGLAVVLSVMEQHGGDLEIRTIPGVGTTFTLYFPLD